MSDEIIATDEATDMMVLNIGPAHPTMHGTLRVKVRLDGEQITQARMEIGYLHRGFEKEAEDHHYQEVIPFTDRLNYISAFSNNIGYAMTVEKLLGIEIPKRAQYIRVILAEFNRFMDHMVCIGPNLVDTGALTMFWYTFEGREHIYDLLESVCGARLTVSYGRIGGLARDVPPDFTKRCRRLLQLLPTYIHKIDKLLTRNPIVLNRFCDVGAVTSEQALNWGWTGPSLRASGVDYDVRKAHPYYDYDQFDWDIPVGTKGDTYDRYLVRMEEMRQSLKIIEQVLDILPDGPVCVDDRRIALPPKQKVFHEMEALINHFKLIIDGPLVPAGELYTSTESPNGELGFYLVSDGTGSPYRLKVRPPCFPLAAAIEKIAVGATIPDFIVIVGSLNIIAGELDR
jgi:NADH-quinone oxidoreductase subunit C/D